ncbi:hypothetical protein CERSUDRAFT_154019 [Gelatoporia subvermispora B]|uniref:Zn(2)-C6 fungal-type domain-containing protein n=1 Tax=Ceriporiopsis subvermispora (strain B) TaxID=914234 RepID=M2PLX8_CERS8|nr:hypothetical protein CERSUDRAFT_154019 [Gelatoporia subvermispora B]
MQRDDTWASNYTPAPPPMVIALEGTASPKPTEHAHYSPDDDSADPSSSVSGSKKRKLERACDYCRRRKTKCDGPRMRDNFCTNCKQNRRDCTYIETSKPRGPPKAYVTGLEDRIDKLETLLRRLRPEADFSAELGPPVVRDSWKYLDSTPPPPKLRRPSSASIHRKPSLLSFSGTVTFPSCSCTSNCPHISPDDDPSSPSRTTTKRNASRSRPSTLELALESDLESPSSVASDNDEIDELGEMSMIQGIKQMTLTMRGLELAEGPPDEDIHGTHYRFHGKSSSSKLVTATRVLKQKHYAEVAKDLGDTPGSVNSIPRLATLRSFFWKPPAWEIEWEGASVLSSLLRYLSARFPPLDLAEKLINSYFTHSNNLFPLLHRPTFERHWQEGLHTRDTWFAGVCMGIFGVASRWSDDPRVLHPKSEGEEGGVGTAPSEAGWKYVDAAIEVHRRCRSVIMPATLFEVQTFSLIGMYLRGTVAHSVSWLYLSIGIRKAQDVGAHRRKVYGRKPTLEEELWKRAFWHLVVFDRIGSMLVGRPCASKQEDMDLDLPAEVDDEYWENEDPELSFRQPADKPSKVTFFVSWIKLSQIIARALETFYAVGRVPGSLGYILTFWRPNWRQEILEQLNEQLVQWVDGVPDHLKWSPTMENDIFASQAASLMTLYHLVQIICYRPFLTLPSGFRYPRQPELSEQSDFARSALSICINAAKAGTDILAVQTQRGMSNVNNVVQSSFMYAGVFLVGVWTLVAREKQGTGAASSRERKRDTMQTMMSLLDYLAKLVKMLDEFSNRWELASEISDEIKASLPSAEGPDLTSLLGSASASSRRPPRPGGHRSDPTEGHKSQMGQPRPTVSLPKRRSLHLGNPATPGDDMLAFAPDEEGELVLHMPYDRPPGVLHPFLPPSSRAPLSPSQDMRAESADALSQVLLSDYLSNRDFRAIYEDARFASAGGSLDYGAHMLWGGAPPMMHDPRLAGAPSRSAQTQAGAPFVKNEVLEDVHLEQYGMPSRGYGYVAPLNVAGAQSVPAGGEYGQDWPGAATSRDSWRSGAPYPSK